MKRKISVVILAAGKGTRMKSETPKVLNKLNNKPLLRFVLDSSLSIHPDKTIVIVGYRHDDIRKKFIDQKIEFVLQEEQLGTAHAVKQTEEALKSFTGDVLILSGDVPLLKPSTLVKLVDKHNTMNSKITILTSVIDKPRGYGRIIRNNNSIAEIIEDKDLLNTQKEIKEINAGIYCIDKDFLFDNICKIKSNNAQKEYYITDIVSIASKQGVTVNSICINDSNEISGINTVEELKRIEELITQE